ncbi:MAG: hypothetical protein IPM38_14955 [Ignavibacteria bacterium]|nr:hypothetical protein [Ignavibacteria bacterium]MBK9334002.1 hypothetical protein [Ignavibacteria bacterium]
MNILKLIQNVFGKKDSDIRAPFVIISKDPTIIEYDNIEVAIAELEKDPEIPMHKMDKIRASFEKLKDNGKVKISNGEIIE